MSLPFDKVRIDSDQGSAELSVGEFLALPFPDRVRAILADQLRFFDGGQPVDRGVALHALRIRQADG